MIDTTAQEQAKLGQTPGGAPRLSVGEQIAKGYTFDIYTGAKLNNTITPTPTQTPAYVPPTGSINSNDLRGQLTNGSIDSSTAKSQLTSRLAEQYGAKMINGVPQFTNPDAQNAYNAALPGAVTALFTGLGDVQSGGQFGEYDVNGNFIKKSTTVNKTNFSTGGNTTVNNNVAVLKGQPTIDPQHQYGSPQIGYFATYAEAENAANNVLKGVNLETNPVNTTGPTNQPATNTQPNPATNPTNPAVVNNGAQTTPPAGGAPQVDANGNPIVTNPAGGSAALPGANISTYSGPSVVDYLTSVGQPSDFSSRARMAANMGISGYTGSASQNTQLLNSLRAASGGKNTSTTTAGVGAGAVTDPNLNPNTASLLANATAIAKSFGWTAPDPKNSPLNIAQDLFKQGLEQLGLTDLKTRINDVLKEQTDLQNKKADDVAEVNANPWLTEGERVAKINKVGEKYDTKLDILVHQQQLYESEYKTGLDQVQWQVGQAMSAYTNAQSQNNDMFSQALTLAEKQVEANQAIAKSTTKATSGGSGGSTGGTTTKSTTSFSTTQLNKGASNAGVSIAEFKTVPDDVKNFYVNLTSTNVKDLNTFFDDVKTGKLEVEQAIAEINSKSMVPAVKDALIKKIQALAPEKTTKPGMFGNPFEGGFFNNVWGEIKHLTGN